MNGIANKRSVLSWAVVVLLGISALCLLSSCAKKQSADQSGQSSTAEIQLTGAGATFPYPLYSKWFDSYKETNQNVSINYLSIGSGGGIQQLTAKTVDFGASDVPLSDTELKTLPAPIVQIPMVAGAIVISYNLPNVPANVHLSGDVIADIFLGTITKWNDPRLLALNPGVPLPALGISVAHRSDGSGSTNIFTTYLAAVSPQWAGKIGVGKSVNWPVGIGGKGNEGVAGVLKQTPGAIGYVELAYAAQNSLTFAAVKNKAGAFVTPSTDSTTAAADSAVEKMKKDMRVSIVNAAGKDAYPICGFTYILLYQQQADAVKGAALVNFLCWAVNDGQQYTEALQYAPLPAGVVTLDVQLLSTVTSNGKPLHTGS
jgi:phosphate transport system substrate-binding protein